MSTPPDVAADDVSGPPWGVTAVRSALALLPDCEEIAGRSVAWVLEHDAEYAGLVTPEGLREASRLCVRRVLSQVAGQELDDELRRAPESIGRGRAVQAAPLEAVLRALRIDYRLVWEAMLDLAAKNDDLDMLELLTDGAARVWDVIDEMSVGVAAVYREVEAELRRSSEERSRTLMGALLRGTAPLGSTVREAATHIGLSAQERFVACRVEAADSAVISDETIRRALARSGMRSAWYTESGSHVGAVQVGSRSPETVTQALATIPDIRAGVSSVAEGLGAVRDNLWQAEAALRAIPPGKTGTALIEAQLLTSLAASAPDLAKLVSDRALGPLSALRPTERARILRTVAAYVNSGGSVARTASELHYHRNTIVNHLRRFEDHTGKSLRDPREMAEVVVALEAERVIG